MNEFSTIQDNNISSYIEKWAVLYKTSNDS